MAENKILEPTERQIAEQRRQQRKAAKKKHAAARNSFLEESMGFVDRDALRAAMDLLVEREDLDLGEPEVREVMDTPLSRASAAPAPRAFPVNNVNRWIPIGPSVVRQGQAAGRPRVSGRVRDLAVSPNGQRAYAATAKGGIWFTGDGGATWEPLGGWANEPRRKGGNTSAFASGSLLVSFGANLTSDFVMVGTGEIGAFQGSANAAPMRGMGVLVALGPASQTVQADPWETATGINLLEGVSIVRMVRVPGSVAGQNGDQVIAATSGGLFLGTRAMVGSSFAFNWVPLLSPVAPPLPAGRVPLINRDPTDLVYVGTRLFVCFRHSGVAISDNNGISFSWLSMNLSRGGPVTAHIIGRMSLSVNDDGNKVYVLGEVNRKPGAEDNLVPHVWQIAIPSTVSVKPAAKPLNGVPNNESLWGDQRDYDQAIEVTTRTQDISDPTVRTDQVYIGGSLVGSTTNGGTFAGIQNWNASLWAFDVAGDNLIASPGVSDISSGANQAGLIGNGVHPDVHCLRKAMNTTTPLIPAVLDHPVNRQLWVGCDGGVFVSLRNGQTNTFASRNVGLASIEVEFVASHPTSSHFAMLGCQDNGRQVRVGESVWELKTSMQGDGGGVIFHPVQSHYVMGQHAQGTWSCDPSSRYVAPIVGPALPATDPENTISSFYSGISAITQSTGNQARIALGTNRVWVTDNLGTTSPNTWRVLPITAEGEFLASRDPRPGNRLPNPATAGFGVPVGLGSLITVKWASRTTLLALYRQGVVRYQENSTGQWNSITILSPGMTVLVPPFVIPIATFFTDIEPVPGGNDFYLVGTGQTTEWRPATPATATKAAIAAVAPTLAADSCFYFDSSALLGIGAFLTTGLGAALPVPAGFTNSPIDPAYSVIVDPANPNVVYVGTATAVWRASKNPITKVHTWLPFVNGLPESTVQDLTVWTDPAAGAGAPRLLRAALQSRGVWEVNLAAEEPVRTYLRVHERDDRRMFPTPMKNPRRRSTAPDVSAFRSPDITIRPQTPVTNTPSFRGIIRNGSLPYQLWTFQTAFRWLYPSVIPNGQWTDQFGDLVERHRLSLGMTGRRVINEVLWDSVMAAGEDENTNSGVYRAAWQNAVVPNLAGSEIDLMESVVPRRDINNIWQVYREQSTVDILLHHRDTRPVTVNNSFTVLLWRAGTNINSLMSTDCTNIVPYVRSLVGGSMALATPAGWNVALAIDGKPLHRLAEPLAARMPRSVAVNIDLSAVPAGRRVLLLAIAGSTADQFSAVPSMAIDRVDKFVRHWPHAAARIISVWTRPGSQLFP